MFKKKENAVDEVVCKACGCKRFVVIGDFLRICENCTTPVKIEKKVPEK